MHVRNVFLSWLSSFSGFSFPPLLRNYALNFVCKYPYQPITCLGNKVAKNIWWLVRVTLVVAFNFLPQNLGGDRYLWVVLCPSMNAGSVRGYHEVMGTLKHFLIQRFCLNLLHSQAVGMQKLWVWALTPVCKHSCHLLCPARALVPKPPDEISIIRIFTNRTWIF